MGIPERFVRLISTRDKISSVRMSACRKAVSKRGCMREKKKITGISIHDNNTASKNKTAANRTAAYVNANTNGTFTTHKTDVVAKTTNSSVTTDTLHTTVPQTPIRKSGATIIIHLTSDEGAIQRTQTVTNNSQNFITPDKYTRNLETTFAKKDVRSKIFGPGSKEARVM